ncbi:MAG TPA: GAF domain-containing protein [Polyangiaceae bacterium]|nr:GAF domain-containing protein [Polyangiaceae bacterium]
MTTVHLDERTDAPTHTRARVHVKQLLELTSRLSEPLPSDEVTRVVVDQAAAAVGASAALMWAVDDPPTHARLMRATGSPPNADRYARIPLEPWLPMGDAMLRREAVFFESRAEYQRRYPVSEANDRSERFRDLSYACLPLVAHGRTIGGVAIVFPGPRGFDDDERCFLNVLAHHAAQALERASLFERAKATRERLEHLQQLTSALSSASTVEEIAQLATRVGTEALGLEAGVVWTIDDRGDLRFLASHGARDHVVGKFLHIPADSDLPGARVVRDRRPLYHEVSQDIDAESPSIGDVLGRGDDFRAYCVLPLVRDDRVLGVLSFGAGRPRRFAPEERSFATTIAEHCADALARARLYDETHRTERRLQNLLDRLPVGIAVAKGPDGDLVFANEALARIWRIKNFETRLQERLAVYRVARPDGSALAFHEYPVVRALKGEIVDGEELRIQRLDGTDGWIHVRAAPVRRDDGTLDVAVVTVVDVTAEKAALSTADEASRAKDGFLAMLGHELRNPLAPIVTALHLMRLRGGGALERERAVIERQVSHLMRLVDDVLDVSRAVRGELRLERAPVEVASVIADAIEVAGPLVEERRHKLTVSVPRTGLLLVADAERIAQVVTNLLTNAAKYTPSGGHITVVARPDGGHIVLEVSDDGAGIAPELLPVVFDAFTQGRQGLDRKQGGLGLGLAIARQLIVAHGGTIEAKSAGPGSGTTMVVRLPRANFSVPVDAASSHDIAIPEPRGARRRVLVVDDNPDAAELMFDALTEVGHEVRTAADAPSALQIVQTFAPDIAFLDIGLPVMDGYELARQLRRIPALKKTPLVAVTGYAQEDDRQRAFASGFTEHLAKPLTPDRVLGCIERLCPKAR